jgi:hypothetical protein
MVLLSGCGVAAQMAMALPAEDAAGTPFNPPPAGVAAIDFDNSPTSGPAIDVMAGPVVIGQLAPVTWMRSARRASAGWFRSQAATDAGRGGVPAGSRTLRQHGDCGLSLAAGRRRLW